MPFVIVTDLGGGRIRVANPASDLPLEDAGTATAGGSAWRIVESSTLPKQGEYVDAWTANFNGEDCVVTVDPARKAAIDEKLAADQAKVEFDSWWIEQIEQGFRSADGIRLGLTTEDVTLLTGNFVLAKEAAALGLDIPPVIDRDGIPHALDIEELTTLMLEYGQHRAALSAEYAQRRAAITE